MKKFQFDYIVVGAGSAGCVMANRLSSDLDNQVLVLEAGPLDRTPFIKIPGAFAYFMFSKKYNWRYEAETVDDIRKGEAMFCPRGKTLGGSSAVNGMVYIRGHKSDYDQWASLGNKGWAYNDLLPYFKKAETNQRGGNEYHGDKGPLYVSDVINDYTINDTFLSASQQAGFPLTSDFNGEAFEGAGYYQFTIKDGERCGVSRAYLKPAMVRSNLSVECEALVERILFDGKKAVGISYTQQGETHEVYANKEVLLCGGAFNSPQTLMLSGIGATAELESLGIPVRHDLPGVGKNLQEHVDACVLTTSLKKDGFTTDVGGLIKMFPDLIAYIKSKKGKLANSITQAGAFLKSRPELDVPDIQLHFLPLLFDDNGRDLKLLATHGYSCHVCVLRPKSRGQVALRSTNPKDPVNIDLNFFAEPEDAKVLVNGIRTVREILATKAFDEYRSEEIHPGVEAQSDQEILAKAKERLGLVYHPVGTCKMGNDSMAVVDDQLRVHGLENLRVIDASVMPTIPSGNTNAPTIAIAEKAADIIMSGATETITSETTEERVLA
jgi:choline dehydrogenase